MRDKNGVFLEEETIKVINGDATKSQFIEESHITCDDGYIKKYSHPYKFPVDASNPFGERKLKIYLLINCTHAQAAQYITGSEVSCLPDSIKNLELTKNFLIVME